MSWDNIVLNPSRHIILVLGVFLGIFIMHPFSVIAQETEELSLSDQSQEDKFETHFFNALAQKAIGHYKKAIEDLNKCLQYKPNERVVNLELAKNYFAIENYSFAEENLKKVLEVKPNNTYALTLLYEIYFQNNDYKKAIEIGEKLAQTNSNYYEYLATLYANTQQYLKALNALDKINQRQGESKTRNEFRQHLLFNPKITGEQQIQYLEEAIKNFPNLKDNYYDLIYLYLETKAFEKATSVANNLIKLFPDDAKAITALYKIAMKSKNYDQAMSYLEQILKDPKAKKITKLRVMEDFAKFVKKHPEYQKAFIALVDEQSRVMSKIINDQIDKDELTILEESYNNDTENYDNIITLISAYLAHEKNNKALKLTNDALEIFPTQAYLYLLKGKAEIALQQYPQAENSLREGLSYVFDDDKLSLLFYDQLLMLYRYFKKPDKINEILEMKLKLSDEN